MNCASISFIGCVELGLVERDVLEYVRGVWKGVNRYLRSLCIFYQYRCILCISVMNILELFGREQKKRGRRRSMKDLRSSLKGVRRSCCAVVLLFACF